MARATAAAALMIGAAHGAAAAERAPDGALPLGDVRVLGQVAHAQVEFIQHDYDTVVEALKPDLQPAVFETLSGDMRYQVLRLYARSLYGLSNWDEAHEAFIDLTRSSRATPQDWLLRMDTALKVGDHDDAVLARDRLRDAAAAASDDDHGDVV